MYKVKSKRSKKWRSKKSKRKSNKKITDLLVSFFPSVLSLLIFNWLFINKNKKNAHTISYIQFFLSLFLSLRGFSFVTLFYCRYSSHIWRGTWRCLCYIWCRYHERHLTNQQVNFSTKKYSYVWTLFKFHCFLLGSWFLLGFFNWNGN